ncbi:MAG: FKBP-type peptidyl-prolyl cis-trans isomerase [Nanoarchaeota archaeon]
MAIEKGKKVKIEYEGSLDNGQVFDSSEKHGQPLEFVIGEGKVIPGFEKAVVEMNKGEGLCTITKPLFVQGAF